MTPTLSRRNRDFTRISINKAPPPLLSPIDVISLKNVFFLSLLYCSPPIMGRIVSGRLVSVPGSWLSPPLRSPLLVSRTSISYPTGGRPTILI